MGRVTPPTGAANYAEYWVRGSTGTDDTAAGRGASFADPWASIQYALNRIANTSGGTSDTRRACLNVVHDDGYVYTLVNTISPLFGGSDAFGYAGTDFATDAGLIIRGVTNDGTTDPAMPKARIGNGASLELLTFNTSPPDYKTYCGYFVLEGIHIVMEYDGVTYTPDSSNCLIKFEDYAIMSRTAVDSGLLKCFMLHYCTFEQTGTPNNYRFWMFKDGAGFSLDVVCAGQGVIEYCLFNNVRGTWKIDTAHTNAQSGDNGQDSWVVHHNVFYFTGDLSGEGPHYPRVDFHTNSTTDSRVEFYHNTHVVAVNNSTATIPSSGRELWVHLANDNTSGGAGVVRDNLRFWGTDGDGSNLTQGASDSTVLAAFFGDSSAETMLSRNVQYNYFVYGPNTLYDGTGGSGWQAQTEWEYDLPVRADEGVSTPVLYSNDARLQKSLSAVFEDVSGTWSWTNVDDSGYSLLLPYNFTPNATVIPAGSDGASVGAIPVTYSNPDSSVDDDVPVYTDSTAFYRPTIKADTIAMIRVRRNKNYKHIDVRHYLRDHLYNEHTLRKVELAGSDSGSLDFGGVATCTGFVLETDQTLNVTLTYTRSGTTVSEQFAVTVDEVVAFDQAPLNAVAINNTSSATANVQFTVFN